MVWTDCISFIHPCADGCTCPFALVLIQQRVQSLLGTHPELGPRAASVQSTGGLLVRSGPTDRLCWAVRGQMLGTRSCGGKVMAAGSSGPDVTAVAQQVLGHSQGREAVLSWC